MSFYKKSFMSIKIFLVLDSGMENVIVTKSISGGLIYGDSHRRKDKAEDQKTAFLDNRYPKGRNVDPTRFPP